MKITISPTQRPAPHPFYGDSYERGTDPWHRNGFPEGLKDAAPNQSGEPSGGWYLIDGAGNVIGFAADGEVHDVPDTK